MPEPIGEHNLHLYLTAFADGELDAAHTLALLDYLAARPEALKSSVGLMRDQQRLRAAVGRVARAKAPPASDALRERVAAMAAPPGKLARQGEPDAVGPVHRRRSRLPVAAVAVAVAVVVASAAAGLLVGRFAWPPPPPLAGSLAGADGPNLVVPASVVAEATQIHAGCARLADALHSDGYPRAFAGLADAVQRDLAGPNPYPDLSPVGYEFIGTGPCPGDLANTLHLLYRERGPAGPRGAVSIFVQPHAGQFPIQTGKLYLVSGVRSPFPVFAWRTERVVYLLLADTDESARQVLGAIAIAPGP